MTRHLIPKAAALLAAFGLASAAFAVDGDVVMKRAGDAPGIPPAVFPHWIHRIRYRCYACHERLFKMAKGANAVTMDAIGQGKFCGACHDGKTAWASSFETCSRCHVATK
jgi:c(7)-type cytochrome triheme protein